MKFRRKSYFDKGIISTTAVLLLLFCAGMPLAAQNQEIPEDVQNAFATSFEAYFFCAMMSAFGQMPPTVTADDETMTFSALDLTALSLENPGNYTGMDGTITALETDSGTASMKADLTMLGGAIRSLKWTVDNFDVESDDTLFQITADGKTYTIRAAEMD